MVISAFASMILAVKTSKVVNFTYAVLAYFWNFKNISKCY